MIPAIRIGPKQEALYTENCAITRGDYGVYQIGAQTVEGELTFIDEDSFTLTKTIRENVQTPNGIQTQVRRERERFTPNSVTRYMGQGREVTKKRLEELFGN